MTVTLANQEHVHTDLDIWSDEVLANPYPHYKQLRDLGPAAYMTKYDMWIITRFDVVKSALADWATFSSAHMGGVALSEDGRAAWSGSVLESDPPEHTNRRKIFDDTLRPRFVRHALGDLKQRSEDVVDALLARGTFDGVQDFAKDLPLNIIMDLVGWPADGREQMLEWAEGAFNALGPEGNQRMIDSFPKLQAGIEYVRTHATEDKMPAQSFGGVMHAAAARGDIPREVVPIALTGILHASLDTTINAMSSLLMLFAQNPGQWDIVRQDKSLVPSAFLEGLRLESPIQFFSRATTRDVDLGEGVVIPADSRVVHSYGAANRDERRYADPDRFDVRRNPTDHLAFDHGTHSCPGRTLATMEAQALFTALAERVETIELVGEPTRELNNSTRGYASMPIRIR
ncbi:cytochrome P450 [Microbacterium elymi]|uniref:Cytochrome P450 n=1 Tax=Microbacterium elymi TaxID=2909587 RepID=A0ABY5NGM3_9MICO|nr:cytochrome P450 [Microbacterium elymi]UUT34298.1 cytochrome P450 [Microbacterium elymi]